jgi:hypothetical protein
VNVRVVVNVLIADLPCRLQEVQELLALLQADINPTKIVQQTLTDLPAISRQLILTWSDRVLAS